MTFWVWHITVDPCCSMTFIPFYGCIIFHVCMCQILFIHSSIDGYLGCFYFLAIIENALMNNLIQVPVWTYVFIFCVCPRNGMAESDSNSMLDILRSCQAVFKSGYILCVWESHCSTSLVWPYLQGIEPTLQLQPVP